MFVLVQQYYYSVLIEYVYLYQNIHLKCYNMVPGSGNFSFCPLKRLHSKISLRYYQVHKSFISSYKSILLPSRHHVALM